MNVRVVLRAGPETRVDPASGRLHLEVLASTLGAMVAFILSAQTLAATDPGRSARPHILIIMADDLGWRDVGFHGSEIATPNLDRLAAAGAQLNQFYVQPVCSPTRAALMTGRYPMRYGLQVGVVRPWADYGLPLNERTLARALQQAGYRTAITGKWHLGCHQPDYLPRQRGFDRQYGHYLGAIDYFTHDRLGGLDWHRDGQSVREEGYTTTLIGGEAARIIDQHDPSIPLLLYVPFNAPHTPLQAPPSYLRRYDHIDGRKRKKYAAMVTCMDDAIGHVLHALQIRGMRNDTLILFCSDNGGPVRNGACNDPLRGGKGNLYEGGVRVPALAVWPGRIEPGVIVDAPLHIVDWYPTLLKRAGVPADQPFPIDGRDAWPTIAEGKPSPHEEILIQHEPTRAALRKGDWKLVVNGKRRRPTVRTTAKEEIELFDLAADPGERNNLADRRPSMVQALRARIEHYAAAAAPPKNTDSGKRPPGFKVPKVWGQRD